MFFDKTINKVKAFYDWNFGDVIGANYGVKKLHWLCNIFVEIFLLVSGTYDTLIFLIYQNLGNAPVMLKIILRILYF